MKLDNLLTELKTLQNSTISYTDQTQGRLVMFLDDATLTDMLRDNPSGLNMLCASFKQ